MEPLIAHDVRPARPGDPVPMDLIVLTYEERHIRRKFLEAMHGDRVLVDLPEATSLDDRDRLVLTDGRHLEIIAAEERLAEIRGPSVARLAWHVGNRHTPCEVQDDCLLIQRDHVLEDMLVRLGAAITHVEAPFRPEGGAYGHGRTHGHSHSHDPQADPNAHIPHRHD